MITTYTFAIQCHDKPRQDLFVFCKPFEDDTKAIAYAVGEIQEPLNKVDFILIRRGNAGPQIPVFWDSRKDYTPVVVKSAIELKIEELYQRNEFDTMCYGELLAACKV